MGTMKMVAKEGSASSILAQLMRFVLGIISTPTYQLIGTDADNDINNRYTRRYIYIRGRKI